MKPVIIKSFLFILFLVSIGYISRYAENSTSTNYGLSGGAAAYGIVSAACILGYIYFECNYRAPKDQEKNK
ncbi:hypothetical protein [Niastella sp. OAS944]|uniref:hypothetical protein n=1 Tax=Niastella sp. OAS944 TaxID=2664089 RepID=UPI0034945121|nr:hypothetical protein [Chitinophagaceae bacterium OAS944]